MNVQALVGWNVARLRIKMKMSQSELAKSCGWVDQAYISGLENGRRNPTAILLYVVSSALGVQVGELFSTIGAPAMFLDGPVKMKNTESRRRKMPGNESAQDVTWL
ncbi:helix-turn-helix domain-containing protein [Asticcacaulis sp. YBE204]|uniref:helix-turn-helix domain-containing protein n=1 Tax=Asticcacaulis sp. YBE204 TaxID=1282363 RepID=UPI0009DD4788|nr:helix-turn-helix transcriptional regulator [Asticcacaulis sp. YBE204]